MNKMRQSTAACPALRSRAAGFTLVELTVALFLAVFLMVGVAEIFKISSDTASMVEAVSDSHQMARSALNMLTQDLSQFAPDG
jgi:Tfp pilus assembly protein PilW